MIDQTQTEVKARTSTAPAAQSLATLANSENSLVVKSTNDSIAVLTNSAKNTSADKIKQTMSSHFSN